VSAGFNPPPGQSYEAGAAVTKYRFVKQTAANTVTNATAQGERVIGVAAEDAVSGGAIGVYQLVDGGIIPVEASAAISAGADVTTGADGRAETSASGDVVAGVAVEAASGAGHVIAIRPTPAATTTT
jgi:hypothetical protein